MATSERIETLRRSLLPPHDWAQPDWFDKVGPHCWVRYVPGEVQELWPELSDETRIIAAAVAQVGASSEVWE